MSVSIKKKQVISSQVSIKKKQAISSAVHKQRQAVRRQLIRGYRSENEKRCRSGREQSKMGKYEFQSRVRYSECGENCRLHLGGVEYFQDAASLQGEELGIGISGSERTQGGLGSGIPQIFTDHMPKLGEQITVRTWAYV